MASAVCLAERSVCAIRTVRLGADCAPLTGATDGAIAVGVMTANWALDVQDGTKFEPLDGCGRLVYTAEDPPVVKRGTLTFELATLDLEAVELMTDASLLLNGADTVGIADPGAGTPFKNAVAIELWTKTAFGFGQCSADGQPGWFRHLFPYCLVRSADRTYDINAANQTYIASVNANPAYTDVWGDWPADTFEATSPRMRVLDAAGPPAGVCGYVNPSSS